MLYETYKLGKLKKNPVRRLYTREELESYELARLREICRAENIKPPTVETFRNREEMAELLYRYLGCKEKEGISGYWTGGCQRVETAIRNVGTEKQCSIEVPARMELYQGQTSLDGRESPYMVVSQSGKLGAYAFLVDGEEKIQAVITLIPDDFAEGEAVRNFPDTGDNARAVSAGGSHPVSGCERYRMRIDRERMSPEISAGRFHDWSIIFMV